MIYESKGIIFNCDVDIDEKEAQAYIDRGLELHEKRLKSIDAHVDGDYIELTYNVCHVPFVRIRRITGYLVGTLDRFNDAKRAEEHDRVKHTI